MARQSSDTRYVNQAICERLVHELTHAGKPMTLTQLMRATKTHQFAAIACLNELRRTGAVSTSMFGRTFKYFVRMI